MSKEFKDFKEENKQWFKVSELAEIIGLSKVSVYNRVKSLNKDALKPLLKIEKGIQYYNIKILELLNPKQNENRTETTDQEEPENESAADISIELDYINTLKEQLKEKDTQIRELIKLNENNQVLLREKPQDVKMLEAHFQDLDNRLLDLREQMQERKEENKEKGFFSKLFKK